MRLSEADDLIRMIGVVLVALSLIAAVTYLALQPQNDSVVLGYLGAALLMMAGYFFKGGKAPPPPPEPPEQP